MSVNHFSVRQLVFDLSFYEQSEAYRLQSRISKLYNNDLHQKLTEFFESCIPSDITFRLTTLSLDLGTLYYDNLEEEITERLLLALNKQFSTYLNKGFNTDYLLYNSDTTSVSLQVSMLQTLETFLFSGMLPWHVGQDTTLQLLEEYLNTKIKEEPAFTHDWIVQLGQHSVIRKRIAWQFSLQTIQNIIELIAPSEASFIISYHTSINELQQKTPIVKSDSTAFKHDVWNFILTFLLKENGSNFSRKEFVKSNLKQLAAHYNVSYPKLLLFFNEAIDRSFGEPMNGLMKFVREVAKDEGILLIDSISLKSKSQIAKVSDTHDNFYIAQYFITHGSLPLSAAHIPREALVSILLEYISAESSTISNILSRLSAQVIVHRLLLIRHKDFEDGLIALISPDKKVRVLTELSITESQLVSRFVLEENDQFKEIFPLNLEAEKTSIVRLIEIFLSSGIFSWWSVPGFSLTLLEDSFMKILTDEPVTARNWLIRLSQQAGVLKRIVWQFNNKTVLRIIEVLEPNDPSFIHSCSIYINQFKGQLSIIAQELEYLQQDVSYFFILFLTTNKRTAFNRKDFVKAVLLQLSAHYKLDYLTLLRLFTTIQSNEKIPPGNHIILQITNEIFIEETTAFIQISALPALTKTFTVDDSASNLVSNTIIANSDNEKPYQVQYNERINSSIEEKEKALVDGQSIENLLCYFIATGTYPWWADAYYSITPSDLLIELYTSNPTGSLRLFQFAGTSLQYMERFLQQFPTTLLLKIIGLLPNGQQVMEAHLEVVNLYQPVNLKLGADWLSKEKFLIKLVWQHYTISNYSSFNELPFYIDAIKHFCHLCYLPLDEVITPILSLIQDYDKQHFKALFNFLQTCSVHQNDDTIIPTLPDEAVSVWLIHTAAERGSTQDLEMYTPSLTEKETYIQAIEHLLQYQFPFSLTIVSKRFSAASLLKTMLLRLQQIDTTAFLALLEKHYYRPGVPQKLHGLFSMNTPEESTILLILNRLYYKNTIIDLDTTTNIITSSTKDKSANETAFIQQYGLIRDDTNKSTIIQVAKSSLDYFLTWEILPQKDFSSSYLSQLPVTEILKELFFILLKYDQNSLHNLLSQKTHLPSARVELLSIFLQSTDSKDLAAAKFLNVHIPKDLLEHFHTTTITSVEPNFINTEQPALPVLNYLITQNLKVDPNEENATLKGFELLQHFLTHNELPDVINQLVSDKKGFLKSLFRYLQTRHLNQLKDLLSRTTNHPEAKIQIYGWGNDQISFYRNEVTFLTSEMLQQDIIVHLKFKSKSDLLRKDELTLSFLQTLTDQSLERVTWVLNRLTESSAGINFLCTNYSTDNILALLKKVDQPWVDHYLELIKSLRLLFERILFQTGFLPTVNQLLQKFILLVFSAKGEGYNTFLFISRFFAFLDNHTTQLPPNLYELLQSFKRYTNNINLFNNQNILLHLQKEISVRLIHSFQQKNYTQLVRRISTDAIESNFVFSNQDVHTEPAIIKTARDEKMHPIRVADPLQQNDLQSSDTTNKKAKQIVNTPKNASDRAKNEMTNQAQSVEILKSPAFVSSDKTEIKVYIQNAGLILLHPFILTLFGYTGLLDGQKFVNQQSIYKAIHLLQYAIDGKTEHEEQHLPLNKIICGLLLEEPVPKEVDLSQDEIAICEDMLKMIFQRWEEMKNTTIDGFRQAFLQRVGILTYSNENWVLRVEQKGYDVLLTTLPWSYGMIKLPWMEKTIYVEWA